jgi:putative ABC transport system permease protein
LVIFQFVISTTLIIATFIVYLQLHYLSRADAGFDKADVINLLHTKNLGTNGVLFKNALLRDPGVSGASYCSRLPPNVEWQFVFMDVDSRKEFLFSLYEMDEDHLETMRYAVVEGRFFSRQIPGDTNTVILNETAARALGIENLDEKKLTTSYDHDGRQRVVIGIIQDFHFQSFREQVQPLAIVLGPEPNWEMAIRLTRGDYETKLGAIRSYWEKYAAGAPFEYTFLDKNFEEKHKREKKLGLIAVLFSGLVVMIACLGLLGLATFTAEQRTKEIGIRKVLGAAVQNIVVMINQDFLKPVLLANLIAWPLAGWMMNQWLNQFAFHIPFPWWTFPLASLITLTVALAAVSVQSRRAAVGDPVKSLRNE